MTDKPRFDLNRILNSLAILIGVLLIAAAVGLIIAQFDFNEKQSAQSVVNALEAIIPARKKALPEPHYGGDMPSAEIGRENFVGLLEVEQYNCLLPVGANWTDSDIKRFPLSYSGNIYNRNFVIGGSSQSGQLDFADEIEIGTSVKFTDLYGHEFCYEVSMVNHADSINAIKSDNDDLTFFARSRTTSKYVIIRCRLS